MSAVLWANLLENGEVRSDQNDYLALHTYAKKLDEISRQLGMTPFESLCDTTDAQLNLGVLDLPDDMESTDALMAADGVWVDVGDAAELLEALLNHLDEHKVRFGLLKDHREEVLVELQDALSFLQGSGDAADGFNFAVVT